MIARSDVADAVREACLAELRAFKPGNVSIHSDGHGMSADDFVRSADCVAEALAAPGRPIGRAVLEAVRATQTAVGCNTNLGIVLLCAPLTHAARRSGPGGDLRIRLLESLAALERADTDLAFEAIRLAEPAGLGTAPKHDVYAAPRAGLLEVMDVAAERDRIARQYVSGFADVFELGLPRLRACEVCSRSDEWATLAVYLEFLARFPDTHIERKFGLEVAEDVRCKGERLRRGLASSERPEQMLPELRELDDELKQRGINPGTSADLTVATLLARRLQRLLDVAPDTRRGAVPCLTNTHRLSKTRSAQALGERAPD